MEFFLSQVELLAAFDPVMNELLKKSKNAIKYLSPTIQNELIEVLAIQLESNIVEEIKSAPFSQSSQTQHRMFQKLIN